MAEENNRYNRNDCEIFLNIIFVSTSQLHLELDKVGLQHYNIYYENLIQEYFFQIVTIITRVCTQIRFF